MRFFLKIFFLSFPTLVWGQDTILHQNKQRAKWQSTKHYNNRYGLNFSYSYQIHSMIEAGISKYLMATTGTTNDEFQSRTHVENNFSTGTSLEFVIGKNFILGTKLFSNIGYKWFSAQLNVTAFTDFNKITPVITPELGIGNWAGIRYGYNIKFGQNPFDEIGTHRIVIFIKLYYAGFSHAFSSYK